MKRTAWLFTISFWAVLAPVQAADVQAHWSELCQVAAGRSMRVTTLDGKKVRGTCYLLEPAELWLTAGHQIIKIARTNASRVQIRQPGYLEDLGKAIPYAGDAALFPVAFPLVLAAIPICILLDLFTGANRLNITLVD